MPDLIKTPSNRRYVVNFQNKEPQNKYDIWLSKNKHDLNGKTIFDSEYLSDSDLVFKIYMNGKWVPILGIPVSYQGIIEALQKKMNLVPQFVDGHIPVFQQGTDECDQLVDGGTIEELVANAITNIINGGGVIPIQRATVDTLGGVKAGLHIHNNNPDQYVEAKFKFPEGYDEGGTIENDRLYISASEIIQAINTYTGGGGTSLNLQLMGPTTRGGAMANLVPVSYDNNKYIPVLINQSDEHMYINGEDVLSVLEYILENDPLASIYEAGEGIDITDNVISNIQATNNTFGGIKADTHDGTLDAIYGIQPKFGTDGIWDVEDQTHLIDDEHLCITSTQIYELLKKIDPTTQTFPIGVESGLYGRFENIGTLLAPEYIPTLGINGVIAENVGKVPTVIPSQSSQSGYDIEWVNLSSGSYSPLTANSVAGDECVVVAPSNKTGFLRWDGQFVSISTGNIVTWSQIWNTGTKIAEISIDGNTTDIYAPNTIYTAGLGIAFGNNNSINIDVSGANTGEVLSYDGSRIDWIPQLRYTAGCGIEMTNNTVINSVIEENSTTYEATSSLVFNCVYASAQHPSGGISIIPDNTPSSGTTLDPYTYTEVTLKMVGSTEIDVRFNTANQLGFMKGNPVYVMLDIAGKNTQINISVPSTDDKNWLINVNNAVITNNGNSCLDITNYSRFLCTLQFGTVKIEPLEATYSINDSQEEP